MRLPFPYRPESDIVSQRLRSLTDALDWAGAARVATPWIEAVRRHPPPFWAMENLLREYPISSAEGLALMRLAEALLRVPDVQTAIALTADQLGRADFDAAGDKALARLSSAAIALSKRFLPDPAAGTGGEPDSGILGRLGARSVVAATLRAVQLLGRQFVLGQTISEGLQQAADARRKTANLRFSYDMLGEGARTEADAQKYLASYRHAIASIANHTTPAGPCENNDGISIKLSALFARYEDAQHARVMAELVPRAWELCEQAARANINLTIDAEEVDRLELSLDVFEALLAAVARDFPHWSGFGLALQAYQTRALELVEHIATLARRYGIRLMCRLVKGAYWDAEIKRAQEMGLPAYPVFTRKHHTDVSYLACARALLKASDVIYPQFATHNAATIAAILQMAAAPASNHVAAAHAGGLARTGDETQRTAVTPRRFELQRLHGMGDGIYREVLRDPMIACRIYAPVGAHKDLLAYLVRRLLENGANSSFVHQLTDASVSPQALLLSPLRLGNAGPLPLPPDLFGSRRKNSTGLDLTVETMRDPLLAAYRSVQLPVLALSHKADVAEALDRSSQAFRPWAGTEVTQRARILRMGADAMQHQMPHFCALLVKEAFKTWGDAVSEVREAVDYLRYYAGEAERIMAPQPMPGLEGGAALGITGESNELQLVPRGPWVCISPWNFPLAIFTGQIAAALATGNTVLAKPAEQTPAVAFEAVRLLHAAGVPAPALQLLHGPGDSVGAALVAASGIAGVVFTGSTQVARTIARALAAKDGPIVPLIAETGGINAMLVDSTALPEQVADAVVQSAFRSAGQRCSALRLLCVHAAIADSVIEMVRGAAQELVTGDPSKLATDLGPVIDREAFDAVRGHCERLMKEARPLLREVGTGGATPDTSMGADGSTSSARTGGGGSVTDSVTDSATETANLIPPQAFEVRSIGEVRQEIFGPVLHIVRWSGDPADVIAQIDTLGYGLTLGIHTRIDGRAQALARAAHVGNVYVNRNQIGAVVGVQPFGGQGLSGTGPKAGGPHYLTRFCDERTITVNTTAAGGNVALLAG